jgi:hypothetical protein
MKSRLVLLAISASTLWTASAQTSIAITNPLFIDDQVKCSSGQSCASVNVSGWICGPETDIQVFSKTQYPNAPAAGLYAAAIGNSYGSGSIFQTLGAAVQANTTYTLKVEVGARADYSFTGYKAALLAGNVELVEGNSATPVGGTFVIDTIVYSCTRIFQGDKRHDDSISSSRAVRCNRVDGIRTNPDSDHQLLVC